MGLLGDLIGNAALAGGDIMTRRYKMDEETAQQDRQMRIKDELDAAREKTLMELRYAYANKPINDYAAAVAARQNDMAPAEAPASATQTQGILDRSTMTGVDGKPITRAVGPGDVGLSGNIAALRKQILNSASMGEEDKAGALKQLDAQAEQQNRANADASPKTRKVTGSEASELAMQDLLRSGNGAAYAAGRPLQTEKTLTVADGSAIIDPKSGKVLFQNNGKSGRQEAHESFLAQQQDERFAQQEKLKRLETDPLGLNGTSAPNSSAASIASGVTGDDFLKTVSKPVAEQVRALTEGRMSFPTGMSLKSPYWQSMLTLVAQYDPSFDAVNYNSRSSTRKAFTSGKEAQSVNALNTVMGHLDSLGVAADNLNNGSFPHLNAASNFLETSVGDARVKKFEATKKAVVDELTRAWRGSGGSEGDIKTWASTLDASNSPEQLHGVIGQLGELLESKIGALNDQYNKGMGTTAGGLNLMSTHATATLKNIKKRAGMESATPETKGAPASGVLTYDPATGTFH